MIWFWLGSYNPSIVIENIKLPIKIKKNTFILIFFSIFGKNRKEESDLINYYSKTKKTKYEESNEIRNIIDDGSTSVFFLQGGRRLFAP